MNTQKNNATQGNVSLLRKVGRRIQSAWRSYSRAVDMAYNRCQTYEETTEMELCGCKGNYTTSLKRENRPFKASVFNDYSSRD